MIVRTYFDKNNTIISNSELNTGRNPVTELFYGGSNGDVKYSRFLFYFDETRLKSFYNDGTFPDVTKLRHILKMTNTGSFDTDTLGTKFQGKDRTSSFNLIVFQVNQPWDEGVGHDFGDFIPMDSQPVTSNKPSNWYQSQTNNPWSGGAGVFSGAAITLGTQHFDQGNENLEIDITDIVNSFITGATNNGLGIAFSGDLEALEDDNLQYVGFFTRHTHTFYEPFVESIYDEHINDDRANFFLDKDNKLYLYVNTGGKPTNLDVLPTVNVYNDSDELISGYTGNQVTHVSKGVYSIDLNVEADGQNDCTLYKDVWSNIVINGKPRPDVELEFATKEEGYFNIGAEDSTPSKYAFSTTGINDGEKIKRGDIRKVSLNVRIPYTINQSAVIDDLEYRLYVREGRNELTVIDYHKVEKTFLNNYFLLDTASLPPNRYYLDVKYKSNYEVTTMKDVLKFEIISHSNDRFSQ